MIFEFRHGENLHELSLQPVFRLPESKLLYPVRTAPKMMWARPKLIIRCINQGSLWSKHRRIMSLVSVLHKPALRHWAAKVNMQYWQEALADGSAAASSRGIAEERTKWWPYPVDIIREGVHSRYAFLDLNTQVANDDNRRTSKKCIEKHAYPSCRIVSTCNA